VLEYLREEVPPQAHVGRQVVNALHSAASQPGAKQREGRPDAPA
jgi:hypothetical protein